MSPQPARTRRRRVVPVTVVATLLVLALVSGMTTWLFYRHINQNIDQTPLTLIGPGPHRKTFPGEDQPLNVLVLGSDSRDCAGCAIDDHTDEGARSDTTILLHLSADHTRAYAVSIPRDSMVDRPRCKGADGTISPAATYQAWNAAYAVDGDSCTVQQFQHLTHIAVDDYVDVNFETFQGMVDAVGGVKVCVPAPIDSSKYGITIPAGTRRLTGLEALAYVRVRHGVGDGSDLSRLKRQQAFLASLVSSVLSAHTLSSPLRLAGFLDAATKGLRTDLDISQLSHLGSDFRHIGTDHIAFITIPYLPDPQNPENTVVWAPQAAGVWRRLRSDRPLTDAQTQTAIRVGQVPGQEPHQPHHSHGGTPPPTGLDADQLSANGLCS